MTLSELKKLAEQATPGPWNYEPERYSAKCVVGIKPRDDRWLVSCQPEFNGESNGQFIAAANPATVLNLIEGLKIAIESIVKADGMMPGNCEEATWPTKTLRDALSKLKSLGLVDE